MKNVFPPVRGDKENASPSATEGGWAGLGPAALVIPAFLAGSVAVFFTRRISVHAPFIRCSMCTRFTAAIHGLTTLDFVAPPIKGSRKTRSPLGGGRRARSRVSNG